MAQHLKIKVIAEGVEAWSQLETLRKLGCRYAQGYLFAEPAPAARAGEFLNGRRLGLTHMDTDVLKAANTNGSIGFEAHSLPHLVA